MIPHEVDKKNKIGDTQSVTHATYAPEPITILVAYTVIRLMATSPR